MRNMITINKQDVINNQRIKALTGLSGTFVDKNRNNPFFEIPVTEDRENFLNYIEWRGLAKDPNLVILSSLHHYYYDAEELKNVNTVINLKELNQIKEVKSFLHSIFHIMPQKSNFIGCFVDNKKINGFALKNNSSSYYKRRTFNGNENGIVSRVPFLYMFYNLMDSKTNKYMSKRRVSLLLEDHGFKVLDMTGLNGLTYFHSQKVRSDDN
jgi:hypothetical protein